MPERARYLLHCSPTVDQNLKRHMVATAIFSIAYSYRAPTLAAPRRLLLCWAQRPAISWRVFRSVYSNYARKMVAPPAAGSNSRSGFALPITNHENRSRIVLSSNLPLHDCANARSSLHVRCTPALRHDRARKCRIYGRQILNLIEVFLVTRPMQSKLFDQSHSPLAAKKSVRIRLP